RRRYRPVLPPRRFLGRLPVLSPAHRSVGAHLAGGIGHAECPVWNVAVASRLALAVAGGVGLLYHRRPHHAGRLLPERLEGTIPISVLHPRQRPGAGGPFYIARSGDMRIGFLAMSGVRAHDPKLLQLGMTLPGVLERGRVVASLPSLGLLYLAAV